MVNGSGSCGLRPGTHFQSGVFRLPKMDLRIDDHASVDLRGRRARALLPCQHGAGGKCI